MGAVVLTVGMLGSAGLAVALVGHGEYGEAVKPVVTAAAFLALLTLRISFYRHNHGR